MTDPRELVDEWGELAWEATAQGRPDVAQVLDKCRRQLAGALDLDHDPEPPAHPGGFVMP